MSSIKTQNETVLDALRRGPMTPLDAVKLGIMRLSARVYDLREQGEPIVARLISVRTRRGTARVAQYTLNVKGR